MPRRGRRSVGTALIRTAEDLALERGIGRLGLGVDDTNPRAAALYRRLGYAETGCRYVDRFTVVDDDGSRREIAEPCRFLVSELASRQ
ncbi:GNAT family N-acetyltransferase [Actinoplanes sp. LDG1-06]|uniref:GNAT family N-acetyltransferase n=1 Tax=Paractinoplanes ovalisporus TaxID=2810368 RepID=A0ABS2A827_9ACTN|nr:GNAT family N-acetyltransferase [Actinoplanes ovalisporus]MBM2615962.1 GNAT family N-acetyltransferase [Actinoplanes ovalisporus]